MDRRNEPARTERVLRLKVQIRQRLEGVCCHFPADEFDSLIERMAQLEIKYTLRAEAAELNRREPLHFREIPFQTISDQRFKDRSR
jgi:hypothetical protein